MFGTGKTYFADSPVVIDISGLRWSREGQAVTSPFTIVRVEVIYKDKVVGEFRADTGGQTSISLNIASALKAIWSDYQYTKEAGKADDARASSGTEGFTPDADGIDFFAANPGVRRYRAYSLMVYTEYLDSTDGEYTTTSYGPFDGGQCAVGGFTEWERSIIPNAAAADVSYRENRNARNGDASTKPTDSPERVGSTSITSWTDVSQAGTKSVFYPAATGEGQEDSYDPHAPLVLRDSQPYVDFLFINRRGAIETCSGLTREAMDIGTSTQQYSRVERPSFKPSRSLTAVGSDGRRSWQMSSGYVTREWAEWWTMEFIGGKRKQWWMLWQGPGLDAPRYVPVIVKSAKSSTSIYDRSKQQMTHVDFTVTLALEG